MRGGKKPRQEASIPGDCILSSLPDERLGLASVWAIQLIGNRIDNPELDCRFPQGWLPGVIRLIDEILQYSRELSENACSIHYVRDVPELTIQFLIRSQLPHQLNYCGIRENPEVTSDLFGNSKDLSKILI